MAGFLWCSGGGFLASVAWLARETTDWVVPCWVDRAESGGSTSAAVLWGSGEARLRAMPTTANRIRASARDTTERLRFDGPTGDCACRGGSGTDRRLISTFPTGVGTTPERGARRRG